MLELNKVMLVGRLTRDPETKNLPSGTTVTQFSIAVNRSRKNKETGAYEDEVSFVDVKAWQKTAEFVERFLAKGKGVFVEGRIEQERWETDGQKRSKIVIVADRIVFAESKAEQEQRSGGAAPTSGEPPLPAPDPMKNRPMPPPPPPSPVPAPPTQEKAAVNNAPPVVDDLPF